MLQNSAICLTACLALVQRGPESYGTAPGVEQRAGISAEDLTNYSQQMAYVYMITYIRFGVILSVSLVY